MPHTDMRDAMRPSAALYGKTPVAEFGAPQLKTTCQAMIDTDLCRMIMNARTNCIRRLFRWVVENQFAPVTIRSARSRQWVRSGPIRAGVSRCPRGEWRRRRPSPSTAAASPRSPPRVATPRLTAPFLDGRRLAFTRPPPPQPPRDRLPQHGSGQPETVRIAPAC